jgi:hypothetical protein
MEMDDERNRTDGKEETESASGAGGVTERLKVVARYAMVGFAPLVSVLALIFAVLAYNGNLSNRAQLNETNLRIDGIGAAEPEPKGETDIFQVSLAREKAVLAEERKKQVEKDAKIISNVTQLQVKLKVSPTLEEQLRADAKAPVAASHVVSAPVAASAVTAAVASTPVSTPIPPAKVENTSVVPPLAKPEKIASEPAPVAIGTNKKSIQDAKKKPAPAPASPSQKTPKASALKQAIEELNKIDRK